MRFKNFYHQMIKEMAKPQEADTMKTYYHGTKEEHIDSIMKNGLLPPDLTRKPNGNLTPIDGKVYLTPEIRYATIYGYVHPNYGNKNESGYGYVCVIDGNSLVDIQPDEDSLAELLYDMFVDETDLGMSSLYRLAKDILKDEYLEQEDMPYIEDYESDEQYQNDLDSWQSEIDHWPNNGIEAILSGELDKQVPMAKIILDNMSDEQKIEVIRYGGHLAHTGKIIPSEIWRLSRSNKLEDDASNFFEIADKIR